MSTYIFLGADHANGLAKASGKPYTMASVYLGESFRAQNSQERQYVGVGTKPAEFAADPSLFARLTDIPSGSTVTVSFQPNPNRSKEFWVTDLQVVTAPSSSPSPIAKEGKGLGI